ncbi:hypothetical protein SISNIDRAFT_452600, partial [Sistotremastrum niveocremeum HHB9708]
LPAILSPISDMRGGLTLVLLPFLSALLKHPSLIFHPSKLSDLFFSLLWIPYGDGVDGNAKSSKQDLIPPYAYGVVLDIGAGHGHTLDYLDHPRITKFIALEPNERMHARIISRAAKYGYSKAKGNFDIIPYGAEEIDKIITQIGGEHTIDTLITILTLCSIPSPQKTINSLVNRTLKPAGGQILFYEHVRSHLRDVSFWQAFWTPVWKRFFGGCRLDQPSHIWIEQSTEWDWSEGQSRMWVKEGEPEEHLFWHRVGRLVRK